MVRRELKIFLTFFFIFSFFSQWNDAWDAEAIFGLTRAIVEEGRLEIDSFANMSPVRTFYNEHYYSGSLPGQAFLSSVVYAPLSYLSKFLPKSFHDSKQPVFYYANRFPITYYPSPSFLIEGSKFFITILTSSLPAALSVLLIYKISFNFTNNERHRLLTVFAYGLGTSIFPYGITFYNLASTTFLILLSFHIVLKLRMGKTGEKKYFFLGGLIAGFATLTYPLGGFICLFLFGYIIFADKRGALIFLLGYLTTMSVLPLHDYSIYRCPLGFFCVKIECETCSLWSFPELSKSFAYQIPLRLLIFPFRGIFFYYPILFFSFLGLFIMFKERKAETLFIFTLFIFFLTFITLYNFLYYLYYKGFNLYPWWGHFSFGPRRFVFLMPFLTIPLVYIFKKINMKIILTFLLISVFVNVLGLQVWEDGVNKETYVEKMEKWQPLGNPLLDRYLPLLLKNGPRSIIFENLLIKKKLSIWNAPQVCGSASDFLVRPEIPLFAFPFGIIALRMPFLCIVPLFFVIFLIWRREFFKKITLRSRTKVIIGIALSLLLLISFVRLRNFVWGDGWFLEGDWNPEQWHWMSENATVLYFRSEKVNETLTFDTFSFARSRNLVLYLNDRYVNSFFVKNANKSNGIEDQKITQPIEFENGLNILKFNSLEGCDIPTEIDQAECNLKCLSFRIGNIIYRN